MKRLTWLLGLLTTLGAAQTSAELYDHDADSHERKNVIEDPKNASTVKALRQLLLTGWPSSLDGKKLALDDHTDYMWTANEERYRLGPSKVAK